MGWSPVSYTHLDVYKRQVLGNQRSRGMAMDASLASQISLLPRLNRGNALAGAVPCKVCDSPAVFFDVVDFNKSAGGYAFGPSGINLPWHRCDNCGFLFTPFFDDWTPDDFSQFIYNQDYALVDPDYLLSLIHISRYSCRTNICPQSRRPRGAHMTDGS